MAMQFLCSKVIQISCFIGDNLLAALKTILYSLPKRRKFQGTHSSVSKSVCLPK